MILKIHMELERPLSIPINYHHILQSIIYNNMADGAGSSGFYHDGGYTAGGRSFKLFCFSLLRGKYSVAGKRITFTDSADFQVRSPEVNVIREVAGNVSQRGIYFGREHIANVSAQLSNQEIESSEILVKMISPMTVYTTDPDSGRTWFYDPSDPIFARAIQDNFLRKYKAYYGIWPDSEIYIEPYKVSDRDKYVTAYKNFYITGWRGYYVLSGERQYLNFLYQAGLGAKNSQGFGMFEVE